MANDEGSSSRDSEVHEVGQEHQAVMADGTITTSSHDEGNEKVVTHEDSPETAYTELSRLERILILGPVTCAYFLWFLDLAVVSTATPAITTEFDSLIDVGWYGGAYQLGSSAFTPLTGKIFRSFSIKWTFLAFFIIFEVGSVLCGAAQSSNMFIVGRAIAGVGCSGISTGALVIISAILPPRAQAGPLGVMQGVGQVGLAVGPVIGGAFTTDVSWRWCFYVNLPIGGVVLLILLWFHIPEPEAKGPAREVLGSAIKSLDLPGFLLFAPAVIMLLLGLQYGGNEYPWNSSVVIGLIVGAVAIFICFLIWERRQGDEAMVPFAMLTNRVIWSAAGNMAFVLASILVADFYIAIYFQAVKNDSPLMSGVHLLPTCIGLVLFTMISGIMIERLGYYLPWTAGGSAISAIGYGLLSLLSPGTPVAKWIGYQVLYGVGSGCTVVGAYSAVQNLVPAAQIPTAMAIVIFCQGVGGAVFLVIANAIFSNSLRSLLQQQVNRIGISPDLVVNAGARGVRQLGLDGERLAIVIQAYSDSVDNVMYLGIGVACVAFAFAWGLGWKDIRVEKELNKIQGAENSTPGRNVEASSASKEISE